MGPQYFATFGASQLEGFAVTSMEVILLSEPKQTEREFRASIGPGTAVDNNYCTTYPISEAQYMVDNYDMELFTMTELFIHRIVNE